MTEDIGLKILQAIVPAILTIIANLAFYVWIKGDFDKQIEKSKISYSGIFKEKIEIYKELLKMIFDMKATISRYQYLATNEDAEKIMKDINAFINFYLINQPFLSDKMLSELKKIRQEFQQIFDDFYIHNNASQYKINPNSKDDLLAKFFEAGNKLKKNQPFKEIEETIIKEMRIDLKVFES